MVGQADSLRRRLSLGSTLRVLRKERGLSEQDVADVIGCSQSRISRIENGRTSPTEAELTAVCRTLEVGRRQTTDLTRQLQANRRLDQKQLARTIDDFKTTELFGVDALRDVESFRAVSNRVIHSLLQTRDYALALWNHSGVATPSGRRPLQMVNGDMLLTRTTRQTFLHNHAKRFRFLLTLDSLDLNFASGMVAQEQLHHLRQWADNPNIEIAVLDPAFSPIHPIQTFNIYDDKLVIEESMFRDLFSYSVEDCRSYRDCFDLLWTAAAIGDEAKGLIDDASRRISPDSVDLRNALSGS